MGHICIMLHTDMKLVQIVEVVTSMTVGLGKRLTAILLLSGGNSKTARSSSR